MRWESARRAHNLVPMNRFSLALVLAAWSWLPLAGEARPASTGPLRSAARCPAPQDTPAPVAPRSIAGATLSGRITFGGKLPEPKELLISEANAVGCTSAGSKVMAKDLRLLVHADRGLANAVVTIEVPGHTAEPSEQPIVLDQAQCRFLQHVVLVPVGSVVEYKNSDSIAHNVHVFCQRNKPFNRTLPAETSYPQTIERAEVLKVTCDIHPWMHSYVFASETPFVSLTDEHGAFRIEGLPPGTYGLRVWHETLGELKREVTIGPGAAPEALELVMTRVKKRKR